MIAYHIALGSDLPDIPYLTRMDMFIFGSTVLVFAALIEVVLTSRLASSDRLDRARRVDVVSRFVFPITFALLAAYSFILRPQITI